MLKQISTGKEYILFSEYLIGRSRKTDLRLENDLVSSEHAAIHWRLDGWELRDLSATNGTFLNDRKLSPGEHANLKHGDRIAFGDPREAFILSSDAPPQALAYAPDGRTIYENEGYLALPDTGQATVWLEREEIGRWSIETSDGVRRIAKDSETITIDGQLWRIETPVVLAKTRSPDPRGERVILNCGMRLTVSSDEEYVDIEVILPEAVERMRPRAHHYLLLVLARRRILDQQSLDLPESEHGWIDIEELTRIRPNGQINQNALNLDIYRARQQLREELKILDAASLIERRRGSKVRIGIARLEIR